MKVICDGPNISHIQIWTDDGVNITRDLDPDNISFSVSAEDGAMQLVLTLPLKGFMFDCGLGQGEPTIVILDEEEKPDDQ